MTKLMNVTVQTFKTENEMELSISRWDGVKDQFMPLLGTRDSFGIRLQKSGTGRANFSSFMSLNIGIRKPQKPAFQYGNKSKPNGKRRLKTSPPAIEVS